MTRVYRLVQAQFAVEALSGEGARRYGGRWNPPGAAVVYASESRALAALETFVHLSEESRGLRFTMFEIALPADIKMEQYSAPPRVWRHGRPTSITQGVGQAWLERGTAQALTVPSVIVPRERNFLLNAEHPRHRQLRVSRREPFSFDERMWKS